MADFDWLDFETGPGGGGWGGDWGSVGSQADMPWAYPMPADTPGWEDFIGGGDPYGPGSSGDTSFSGEGSGNWLGSILGGLGSVGSFLGKNAGTLGPLLSGAGSLAGGAIGSNAANEAARLQAAALNRGIDLQTAQWLQQQGNLAPYLQAGQQGLSTLQGLAGREQPGLPGTPAAISGANYALPSTTPGWTAGQFQWPAASVSAEGYRWTPGQGPSAQDYRYTPGNIPAASQYRYTPGAVPTLSGQELLANDPGVAFRLGEGRKALEASAAARGGLLSGPTLAALQRQGQELSSQEYGNAWTRASQQAQLREGWAQTASQMGWGQAESEARLREQVNQIASQQGWSQAQAEAVFREQMAQQAGAQNWSQALQGNQNAYNQMLGAQQFNTQQAEQWATQNYNRMLEQQKMRYGMEVSQNTTDYDRQQAAYKQQLAQYQLPWENASTLANLGGQATGLYGTQGIAATRGISELLGQLGSAQGTGSYGSGLSWMNALTGAGNQIRPLLSGLNA